MARSNQHPGDELYYLGGDHGLLGGIMGGAMSFWIYVTYGTFDSPIFCGYNAGNVDNEWGFNLAAGYLEFYMNYRAVVLTPSEPLATDEWVHVAWTGVYYPEEHMNSTHIFINGSKVIDTIDAFANPDTSEYYLFSHGVGSDTGLAIAEIGTWNRYQTDEGSPGGWLYQLYNQKYMPSLVQISNLSGAWRLLGVADPEPGTPFNWVVNGADSFTHPPGIYDGTATAASKADFYRRRRK